VNYGVLVDNDSVKFAAIELILSRSLNSLALSSRHRRGWLRPHLLIVHIYCPVNNGLLIDNNSVKLAAIGLFLSRSLNSLALSSK
jgi:hypothetical protein